VLTDFLGITLVGIGQSLPPTSVEYKTYHDASPVYWISKDTPPFLLVHGEADTTVVIKHSELMEQGLKAAGVPVKLLRVPGAGHGFDFSSTKNLPDYLEEMVRWFGEYLRTN
jgi:dipeptidyl aminopeptidase/acylaminoacyl peptidase